MYLCNMTRHDLLDLLPKGGEVAEIGVAEGTFSRQILERTQPKKLHLVDPWEFQARADYEHDLYGNAQAQEQEKRFEDVRLAFDAELKTGQVAINRAYSTKAASRFKKAQLDWVYVDAMHTREAVAADLKAYKDKIKPDGFILGHDYTNHGPAQNAGFGVVEAVNDFVLKNGYRFLLMTMENFPTYVLTKEPESEAAKQLVIRALYICPAVIELADFPSNHQFQHHALRIAEKSIVYYGFKSPAAAA